MESSGAFPRLSIFVIFVVGFWTTMCMAFPYDLASEVAADLAAVVTMASLFAVFDGAA